MKGKSLIIALIAFLICCALCLLYGKAKWSRQGYEKGRAAGYAAGYSAGYAAVHPSDTTIVVNTTHYDHPEPSGVIPAGYELAPIGTLSDLRALVDSLSQAPDTVIQYLPVPIERKEFRKPEYFAVVTGYNPKLEYIETYNEIKYITVPYVKVEPYRWTLSIFADAHASLRQFNARAGILYEARVAGPLRASASVGYEYGTLGHGPFLAGGLKLDLAHNP